MEHDLYKHDKQAITAAWIFSVIKHLNRFSRKHHFCSSLNQSKPVQVVQVFDSHNNTFRLMNIILSFSHFLMKPPQNPFL
jgi:hypothetical protein